MFSDVHIFRYYIHSAHQFSKPFPNVDRSRQSRSCLDIFSLHDLNDNNHSTYTLTPILLWLHINMFISTVAIHVMNAIVLYSHILKAIGLMICATPSSYSTYLEIQKTLAISLLPLFHTLVCLNKTPKKLQSTVSALQWLYSAVCVIRLECP